jgi:hypothetical protein
MSNTGNCQGEDKISSEKIFLGISAEAHSSVFWPNFNFSYGILQMTDTLVVSDSDTIGVL